MIRDTYDNILLEADTGQVVLNEIYFGKQPQLLMIEDLFEKFKASYKKEEPMKNLAMYREIIKDPILKKIGAQFADLFGFKEVAITISRDDTLNAYTMSFRADKKGVSYDLNENPFTPEQLTGSVIITNSGFMFNKRKFSMNLLICLNLGILFKTEISTPELIAILLHEVGHNFSKVVISAKKVSGRVDEKFADQFVAMYGYSKELVSAFSKMTINYGPIENLFKDVPVVNILVGLSNIYGHFLMRSMAPDVHPSMISRQLSQIKQLEADLKSTPNLSPEMKKDIQNQIEECQRLIDQYYDTSNDNMADTIAKKYFKNIDPNLAAEQNAENQANKVSQPTTINDTINKMYKPHGSIQKMHTFKLR